MFGCRCVIFIHAGVSDGRREAIAAYGAEVIRVAGNYDDSVRHAAERAARHGWIVVSDTSYEGYVDIPRDVMHGYTVIADEIIEQIAGAPKPTHAFVQAGVGGLAAAVCARFWQRWGAKRPVFVVVEPEKADCNFQSARTGRPAGATGDLDTIMAGLSCGEVSPLAWQVLERGADAFITISDEWALDGVRLTYRPVTEKVRPTRLGLIRRKDARQRRMAQTFADFCKEFVISGSPMTLRAYSEVRNTGW